MTAQQLQDKLIQLNACEPAIEWANGKDLETAWNTCERGDWMIWLLTESQNEVTDKQLRLIAVECCRSVQRLMTDQRSINAVDVAERYANGEATDEELRQAQAAAEAAWAAWAAESKKQSDIVRKIVPNFKFK